MPGQQIAAFAVIHQNAGLVCHLGVAALDEDIRDLVLVQHFVQVDVAAEDLALLGSMMRPSMGLSRSSFKTFSSLERLLQVFFKIML